MTNEPNQDETAELDPITKLSKELDDMRKENEKMKADMAQANSNMVKMMETNRNLFNQLGQQNNQNPPAQTKVKDYDEIMIESAVGKMKSIIESG